MVEVTRIGMDTSKSVFQLHGVDAAERPVLRRRLRRGEVVKFFASLAPCAVGLEACGGAHHWARVLGELGHAVKLVPPQYAKAYVKRNKNDAADAAAICEAMSRPHMPLVPVKTAARQAACLLVSERSRLVRERTRLANRLRGLAMDPGSRASPLAGVTSLGWCRGAVWRASRRCWRGCWSARCRSWRRWRWPTRWRASPGS